MPPVVYMKTVMKTVSKTAEIGLEPYSSQIFDEKNINDIGEIYHRKENVGRTLGMSNLNVRSLEANNNESAQNHGNKQHP